MLKKVRSSRADRLWAVASLLFGLFYGVASALDWGPEYALVAFSLGVSITLALLHPTVAVCLLTSLLFLRPWELIDKNDYFMMLPKLCFGICIAHLLLIFAERRSVWPEWNRATTWLLAFGVWALVTTFKAPDPDLARAKFFDTFFKAGFLYLMVLNVVRERWELKVLLGTMVLTFLGVGAVSIYQTLELIEASQGGEVRLLGIGAFSNSNDIAALMVMILPFSLVRVLRRGAGWTRRVLGVAMIGVVAACIHLSQSRGAMVAIAVALSLFAAMRIRRRWVTVAAAAGSLALVGVTFTLLSRSEADQAASSESRLTYIKTGLAMGFRNPVFGVGYEGYEENFEKYATELLHEWGHRTAHNTWVLAFAEAGLPGLVFFLALFVSCVRMSLRVFPLVPEFLISLVGYAVAITFLSHTYLLYPYLLYALIGVAHRLYAPGEPA